MDPKHATFRCDFKLFFYWKDSKYVGRRKNERLEPQEEGAFWPDLIISNEAELHVTHEEFTLKDPATGEVKFSQYYRGTLTVRSRCCGR